MVTLYTSSRQDLLESLSKNFSCSCEQIEDSISNLKVRNPEEIILKSFYKSIGLDTRNEQLQLGLLSVDSVIMSHLSSRISEPNGKPFLNLHEVLTKETDLSNLFLKYGVRFVKRNQRIVTYFKDSEVNWDNYSSYAVARVKKRLLLNNVYRDHCINGFLFNDQIWKDTRVSHLYKNPEILEDISTVLGIEGIIDDWREKAKLYCIGVKVKIVDIYFDGLSRFSLKSKIFHLYRQSIYYLKVSNHGMWFPERDNPMIRLKDYLNLNPEDIFGFYEVNPEDFYS